MLPQDIERYVLMASDASNLQLQQQANGFLNQWVASTNDNVLADAMIEVIRITQREVVLFYALTVFSRLNNANPHQRSVFRQELFSQLCRVSTTVSGASGDSAKKIPSGPIHSSNNYHNGSSWSPTYLRTKIGVLLARFIQLDFPHAWPSAFDDLQSPILLQTAPDILLRTLVALTDDFGRDETEINTKIKDLMRGYNNADDDIHNNGGTSGKKSNTVSNPQQTISGRLMETILSILDQALTGNTTTYSVLCLTVLKGFLSWVDISLVMGNDVVLQLIFRALANGSTVDAADGAADAGVVSIQCMEELIARGMEDEKKIAMLGHTRILEEIHNHVDLITVDASSIDVVLEVAKFINRTGLEILPIIYGNGSISFNDSSSYGMVTMKNQLMELFFRCFAFDDIDVSGAVIPLAASLVPLSDPHQHLHQQESLLPKLLSITYNQMRYPPDFQYDFDDDDEAEEEMYRTELRKLNQKFVQKNPDLCLQYTCQMLSQLQIPLSKAPTSDVEAAVSLVYQYCEGIRPPPGMKVVMRNETFCNLLVAIHLSDITDHPHREVLTLYYETSVRYFPLLKERPDLLQKVLGSMTGTRGLQHENGKVRSRCCYLLLRLIKSVGNTNKKSAETSVLRPYIESAVAGIQGLLENKSIELRVDDTLNLFETIGLLLGKNGLPPTEQGQYLTQVMTPHVRCIEMTLREEKQKFAQDPDTYGEVLSGSIAAIAYLSKGFKDPPPQVQTVLLETLQIAISVLEALPDNEEVRSKTYIFVQRLIQCLQDKVLNAIPRLLHTLIQHCTTEDILDVSQLINQLCIKFRGKAAVALDSNLLPFLQKCHHLSNAIIAGKSVEDDHPESDNAPVAPHLRTEQLSIQKLSYAVMNHVVSNDLAGILLSPCNASSLEAILQSMSEGAISVEDPLMKKTCLNFFRVLLNQWVTSSSDGAGKCAAPDYVTKGYVSFLCDNVIPRMLQSFLRADLPFNVQDANTYRLLVEFSRILEILKSRLPAVFGSALTRVSAQMQLPVSVVDGFRTSTTAKQFEECLKASIPKNKKS